MSTTTRQRPIFLFILFICLLILISFIFYPFLDSLIFSILLAAVFHPWHWYQVSIWSWKPTWSAMLVTLFSLVLVLFPTIYITTTLFEMIPPKIEAFRNNQSAGIPTIIDTIILKTQDLIQHTIKIKLDLFTIREKALAILNSAASQLGLWMNSIVSNFFHILFTFLLTHIILFAWLKNGRVFKNFFLKFSPLTQQENQVLMRTFIKLNNTLMKGNAISGTFQALVAYILFKIAGFEEGLFFSLLIFIASFVPVVGTSIIFLPISIYLWVTDNTFAAISVLTTCSVAFLFMENWFKPNFIGERLKIHPVVVLISLLGGVKILGIVGLFYGPVIVGMFFCVLNLLHKRVSNNNAKLSI
jgi:predicted PurR-regulated permease PerM